MSKEAALSSFKGGPAGGQNLKESAGSQDPLPLLFLACRMVEQVAWPANDRSTLTNLSSAEETE
jgi:hypothetical protein